MGRSTGRERGPRRRRRPRRRGGGVDVATAGRERHHGRPACGPAADVEGPGACHAGPPVPAGPGGPGRPRPRGGGGHGRVRGVRLHPARRALPDRGHRLHGGVRVPPPDRLRGQGVHRRPDPGGRGHRAVHVHGDPRAAPRRAHAGPDEEAQDGTADRRDGRPRDRLRLGTRRARGGPVPGQRRAGHRGGGPRPRTSGGPPRSPWCWAT